MQAQRQSFPVARTDIVAWPRSSSPKGETTKRSTSRYQVARHAYWISHARDGSDIGVSVYDISPEGLALMKTRQWDPGSEHDAWWLEFVHDVNGVDMLEQAPHREPPEMVFSWQRS